MKNKKIENDWLEGLRRGDKDRIRELYEHAYPQCSSFVTRNRGTVEDARDLFQDSLMILFKNIRKEDFELTCNVKTYLYSIVRNLWLKRLGSDKKSGLSLVIDEPESGFIVVQEDTIEEKTALEKKHELIGNMLQQLKEDCKQLLIEYYFKKIKLKEIGKRMGYTDGFVRLKKNRCMEALKQKVNLEL